METDRPRSSTPATGPAVVARPGSNDSGAADWSEADWACVFSLRRAGLTDPQLWRLLRLRRTYHGTSDPATDGLERNPKALFARWLVAQGRLNEGL